MEAIYFGNARWHGNTGAGTGPWAGADLEQGMYYGGGLKTQKNTGSASHPHDFVSLALKGRTDGFDLKGSGSDATQGEFKTMYSGPRPDRTIAGTCISYDLWTIELEECVAGSANQSWGFTNKENSLAIANGANCLDVQSRGTKQGNTIWACAWVTHLRRSIAQPAATADSACPLRCVCHEGWQALCPPPQTCN